jgi:hypothetical protein
MEANLRALPLDRALSIEIDGNRAVLRDGDTSQRASSNSRSRRDRRWRRPRRRAVIR